LEFNLSGIYQWETESDEEALNRLRNLREQADQGFHNAAGMYEKSPSRETADAEDDAHTAYITLAMLPLSDFRREVSVVLFNGQRIPIIKGVGYEHYLDAAQQEREEFERMMNDFIS